MAIGAHISKIITRLAALERTVVHVKKISLVAMILVAREMMNLPLRSCGRYVFNFVDHRHYLLFVSLK